MERIYLTENDAERDHLRRLISALSDADLASDIGHGWTAGVALAHLAFWDRLWLAKLEEFERTHVVVLPALGPAVNALNDGMLGWWQNIAPAQVRYEVVAAAEAIDQKVSNLPDWIVEPILAARPRTLNRAVHRRQHLGEIESALKDREGQKE